MARYRTNLMLCAGTGCVSNKSLRIREVLEKELKKHRLEEEILIVMTGCNGFCAQGPILVVRPEEIFYQMLTEKDIPRLVEEHFLKGRPVKELMYTPPQEESPVPKMSDIGFFREQRLIALRNRGLIDPEKIDESIARGGYSALAKAVTSMNPEEIIKEIKESGLRGRGGAGFPTGKKWEFAARAKGEEKYIICNADEGDPGAFMDRSILESDPHSVLEGMAIGALAIGAHHGYIYARSEYPLAVQRMRKAIKQAREYGLLGEDIFGTGFDFEVSVHQGAGAFVCGEETSLIASLEGRPPEPRIRPPFPAQSGLWGKPTNINNVETWANVPEIINRGAAWYSQLGTDTSKGTKVFSLVGKVKNTGLIEVPMGTTLGKIIYDIGGGILEDKKFKAVQTGGPSGGCIPTELLNLPIDYERLIEVGSIMGSGGMIVMDEDTCMVDVAHYFIDFVRSESCGKCTSCREGLEVMYRILSGICEGKGKEGDIELLEELGAAIKDGSMCALGQTAPNPVLSTIKHFRQEYEQHIKYKKCPAAVCQALFRSPCQHVCPAEIDIPGYIYLISQGRYEEAVGLMRERNPLVSICGRVCDNPCEAKCRRQDIEEGLAIRELKRYATDCVLNNGGYPLPLVEKKKGKSIAIVGSGPAGLTCAYHLARMGYQVTVFEALPLAGGMLAVGIPEYRLPRAVIKKEIEAIKKIGVEIKTGVNIGKDMTLAEIFDKGYQAVFVASGAHQDLKLGIDGEELDNVVGAVRFLRDVSLGKIKEITGRAVVIGGGNAAIDAARSALRLGADEVHIVYRRRREDMPAHSDEVRQAEKEGVKMHFLANPLKLIGNGKIGKIECLRMKLADFDSSGRRRPVPIEGSQFTMDVDLVVAAIGQRPNASFVRDHSEIKLSKRGTIAVDPDNLGVGKDGIFAGGDVVRGPATVIEAIGDGIDAAISIDNYLGGKGVIEERIRKKEKLDQITLSSENPEVQPRVKKVENKIESEVEGFTEVEWSYSESEARCEASRCLHCDIEVD